MTALLPFQVRANSETNECGYLVAQVWLENQLDQFLRSDRFQHLASLSPDELHALDPSVERAQILVVWRAVQKLALDQGDQAKDELSERLRYLATTDRDRLQKLSDAVDLWKKDVQAERYLLSMTEEHGFVGEGRINNNEMTIVMTEKMRDFDFRRAFKAYSSSRWQEISFFQRSAIGRNFKSWLSSGLELNSREILVGLRDSFESYRMKIDMPDYGPHFLENSKLLGRDVLRFLESSRSELNEPLEFVYELFQRYVTTRLSQKSARDLSLSVIREMSRARSRWSNSVYKVSNQTPDEVKTFIPLLYQLHRHINQYASEDTILAQMVHLDLYIAPPPSLLARMPHADKIREMVFESKGAGIHKFLSYKGLPDTFASKFKWQMQLRFGQLMALFFYANGLGVISAPLWIPFAIIYGD